MNSRMLIRKLEQAGWRKVRVKGSHHQFSHPNCGHVITVPHPKKDLPKGTVKAILKSADIDD